MQIMMNYLYGKTLKWQEKNYQDEIHLVHEYILPSQAGQLFRLIIAQFFNYRDIHWLRSYIRNKSNFI